MNNFWLTRKKMAKLEELKLQILADNPTILGVAVPDEPFDIPVPPLIPMIDIGPITWPDPCFVMPPIRTGGCIDISGMEIPTEIKLENTGIPTQITLMMPEFIPPTCIQMDKVAFPDITFPEVNIPPIVVDWGTPPVIDCIITITCPEPIYTGC